MALRENIAGMLLRLLRKLAKAMAAMLRALEPRPEPIKRRPF